MVAFFGKIDFYENSRAFRRGWRDGSLWDTTVMRLSFFLTSGSQGSKTDEMNMIWIYGKSLKRDIFFFHFLSTIPSKPAHLRSFLWCFFWFCDQVAHDPFMLIWMQSTWEVCRKTYIYIYIFIYINYISYRFIWLTQQVCVGPKWTEPTGPKMGYSIEWD